MKLHHRKQAQELLTTLDIFEAYVDKPQSFLNHLSDFDKSELVSVIRAFLEDRILKL